MGNDHTLALIAKAAQKLARLDPEFNVAIDRQRRDLRRKQRRNTVRALAREFDRSFKRVTRISEAEITIDAGYEVECVKTQDALLVSLDTVISAPGTDRAKRTRAPQKPVSASERRKRRGNRRELKRYTHKGQSRTLKEWAAVTGIKFGTIVNRLRQGWSIDETLTIKVGSIMGDDSHARRRRAVVCDRGWSPTLTEGARTSGAPTRDIKDKQAFFEGKP